MKYVVLIIDGASGLPLPERGGKTSLELAQTPNLDAMAGESVLGTLRTVPEGMEPSMRRCFRLWRRIARR